MKNEFLVIDQKNLESIRRKILDWGRANFKGYPWREERDPWLTLMAEILLQRTRASQVEAVYRDLCAKYPTATSLANAGPNAARELTSRLGLHWRGNLLYQAAVTVRDLGGVPPESVESLRKIPGVGPYTTAAWLSLHRGKRAVIVDANVARWLSRVTGKPKPPDPRHCRWLHELADRLTPLDDFRDYNYAVLDFTTTVCVPRRPQCGSCPISSFCAFSRKHSSYADGEIPQNDVVSGEITRQTTS